MNSDSITLLKECNSGCKMATNSMEQVKSYVENQELLNLIEKNLKLHTDIGDECHVMLNQTGEDEKDPSKMAATFAKMETEMKLLIEKDTHKIAEILIDGCHMGIKSLSENLNKYKAAEGSVISQTRKLIKIEQIMGDELLTFL